MARKPRIEYPGAVYHVMCRGDRLEPIYLSDRDREIFLQTLGEACEKTGWKVHSYVLMSNHYHLLLETPEANLVVGMKWFQGTYTQRFNVRNQVKGHLFQGRYKALPVDVKEAGYFQTVSSYIHLNPARAGLLNSSRPSLSDYSWSSYPFFLRSRYRPSWLHCDRVLACYQQHDAPGGRAWYRRHMQKRLREVLSADAPGDLEKGWEKIRSGWMFGSPQFRQEMVERVEKVMQGKDRDSFSGQGKVLHDENQAEKFLSRGLKLLKLSRTDLSALNKNDIRKQGLAWLLRTRTSVSAGWVAERLSMGHRVSVSHACKRMRESDRADVTRVKNLMLKLTD